MFTIYSDKDIFENIISSPNDYPNWNKIINNHSAVCLDINEVDLDIELDNPDSILFLLVQSNAREINIIPLYNYFQKIYDKPETVIENPSAAYFLNLTKTDAKKLQHDTGIIINCCDEIDDELIVKGSFHEWGANEKIPDNWKHILAPFYDFPSNSIIINDRNLFTNEERLQNLGIHNIIRLLNNILPEKLENDYHILIQSEQKSQANNKQKCDRIAEILNTNIRKLRPYDFTVELVFYNRGTKFFEYTHSRRIISNYIIARSEYGFTSFKISDYDITKNIDSFNMTTFFNNLNSHTNCLANLKTHNDFIKWYKEIVDNCINKINQGGPNDNVYRYYLNGLEVKQGESTVIHNRLLN